MARLLIIAALIWPSAARAEHVVGFGDIFGAIFESLFHQGDESIGVPVASVGGGYGFDGATGSVAAGWGWGTREHGVDFHGVALSRVQLSLQVADRSSIAATYGRYANSFGSFGVDGGVTIDRHGAGLTGRLFYGLDGIGVRFSGDLLEGDRLRATGRIELVVEVTDLVGAL
jgi:hypothetical protein